MDPDNFSPVLLGIISSQPLSFSAYVSLILGILLLFCSAFVSASEVAFFSLEPQDVDELRQKESANASKVLKLLEYPQKLLATILISNNFVNVAIIILITHFSTSLFDFSMAPIWGFVIQTIVITFLLLLFGEIMPKVYATQYPMKMALFAASTLLTLEKVLSPFVALLVKSSAIMNTDKVKTRNNISMDELSQALELTSDTEEDEKDMLEGIIKFGNIQVADIMRSRVDIISVEIKSSYKELMRVIVESGYSRIPVFAENHDNIKGLIYSKDLLPHLEKPDNFRWQTLIRPAYFVPESKKIDDLLKEFQETKVHLAIVVDEYDDEEKLYVKVDDDTYVFEGKILLNDFYKITDIDESVFEKVTEDVETLAGLVLELKGEIPKKGDKVNMGPYEFEVVAVDNRRINKIRFHVNEEARKTEEE